MVINDTVMGGVSRARVVGTDRGTLLFEGSVSLENNGGFASTRLRPRDYDMASASGLALRIKGDGRTYQLRLRTDDRYDGVTFRAHFATSGSWETVTVPFSDFVPTFRGRILRDVDPLDPNDVRQVGFLIADKQTGPFRLEIGSIDLHRD